MDENRNVKFIKDLEELEFNSLKDVFVSIFVIILVVFSYPVLCLFDFFFRGDDFE